MTPAGYSPKSDPIAELALTLDSLDRHISVVDDKARRSETNRLSMLHLHALAACVIAPLFALVGEQGMTGPIWVVTRQIPGAPYSLASLMFIGGVMLGASTFVRGLRGEIIGLWMILAWYAIIATSFLAGILFWFYAGTPEGMPRPGFYAPAVYFHLTAIMMVHLHTLRRMVRARRAQGMT